MAAPSIAFLAQELGGHLPACRGIDRGNRGRAGEAGESLAMGQEHAGRGEAVTARVRALPNPLGTLQRGLHRHWSTTHRATDVPSGVGTDQEHRAAGLLELRDSVLHRSDVTFTKSRPGQPKQPRRVIETVLEQPGTKSESARDVDALGPAYV